MNPFSTSDRVSLIQHLDEQSNYGQNEGPYFDQFLEANSINVDLDTPIYRIMDFDRIKQILQDRKIAFVRPALWEDPFENFLLNSVGVLPDGEKVSLKELKNQHYAQCWTFSADCDGLWRNFKKNSNVVKVSSTVGTVFRQVYDLSNTFHTLSYFVGKVEYVSQRQIEAFLNKTLNLTGMGGHDLPFVITLLTKRAQFSYENEVRFIFVKPSGKDIDLTKIRNPWDDSDYFQVNIDPNLTFDEIQIEPWVNMTTYADMVSDLQRLGFTNAISRSATYSKPFFEINIK